LQYDPERFLNRHLVKAEEIRFTGYDVMWFGDDGQQFAGDASFVFNSDVRLFDRLHDPERPSDLLSADPYGLPPAAPTMVPIFGVHMLKAEEVDIGALPRVEIPAGVDLICTVPISGCCLVFQPYDYPDGAGLYMAHVRPPPPGGLEESFDLQVALTTQAAFAGVPRAPIAPVCFGRMNAPPPSITSVIGVRGKDGWEIWAQTYTNSPRNIQRVAKIALRAPE